MLQNEPLMIKNKMILSKDMWLLYRIARKFVFNFNLYKVNRIEPEGWLEVIWFISWFLNWTEKMQSIQLLIIESLIRLIFQQKWIRFINRTINSARKWNIGSSDVCDEFFNTIWTISCIRGEIISPFGGLTQIHRDLESESGFQLIATFGYLKTVFNLEIEFDRLHNCSAWWFFAEREEFSSGCYWFCIISDT